MGRVRPFVRGSLQMLGRDSLSQNVTKKGDFAAPAAVG